MKLENQDLDDYASSGYDTSTASLTSSVNEYLLENGRKYHVYYGEDKNLQPIDETEQDRLDFHHEIFLWLLNGELHQAPIDDNPQRILDVGTGTGIWAIDMADKHPQAEVIGTDLSPIQPRWVPPNCRFEVDDAELEWTFEANSFDFIHMRNLAQGVTDWHGMLEQAYRCTKPGGYIELGELGLVAHSDDGSMQENDGVKRYMDYLREAMLAIGRLAITEELLETNLRNAGFEDVHVQAYKQPVAPWPRDPTLKRVGAVILMGGEVGYQAYGMAPFTRILGMTVEEATAVCSKAYRSSRNKNSHVYVY
ncbi:S-adenosyl-L-methionine-dependent methyltransferase [Wilcoxina mikolae CBS 423.85]|nr:S-adenosyl-L-methionine-dependent methyltransferase [Wilcoxina mikolae CBS 423.85]